MLEENNEWIKHTTSEQIKIIRNVINTDKSGLAKTINEMQKVLAGYDWIANGEWGPYPYDERTVETLQAEVRNMLNELDCIAKEGLKASGNRVAKHIRSIETALNQDIKTGAGNGDDNAI